MGANQPEVHIPVPTDEFRKQKRPFVERNEILDPRFQQFLLEQIEGKYSIDISTFDEQKKRDTLLGFLTKYISDIELGPEGKDEQKNNDPRIQKRDAIFASIDGSCELFIGNLTTYLKGLEGVKGFDISKGMLSLYVVEPPKTNTQIRVYNISELFKKDSQGRFFLDEKKLALELQGRAKEDLSRLRESLETESLFGGAVVISYEQKEGAKRLLGGTIGILGVAGGLSTTEYLVRKILFRDETGKMQEVDPKIVRTILRGIGDKTRINSMILRIMRDAGKVYNPIRNAFTDISTLSIDRATERVKSLKRTDIEKGGTMTDAEFEGEKQKVLREISRIPRNEVLARVGKIIKSIPSASLQGVMYGVFFIDYQKHSYDTAQIYRGFAEAGLFEVGQAVGQRLAPGIWKVPASLAGGVVAILGGHAVGGAIQLDKKVWRALPERMMGDGSKSFASHAITGGTVNDAADRFDRDIGIPGTRGGAVLYNPFGKDGIMPNVDFAGTHITFGTDPRQYLQSRVGGTDIHWNVRMDQYVSWATTMTMRILQEYDNNRGYFASSNGKKEELLKERLRHVFDSEDGANKRTAQIIDDCIDYVVTKLTKIKDLNSRKELLSIFLGNYGNILKIDGDSLAYDEKLLERDKSILDRQTQMYLSLLPPDKRILAERVFMRLQIGDRLVDGKMITHAGGMPGQEVESFVYDKKELTLYQSLLDDTTPVKQEWYDILGYNNTIDYQNTSFNLPDKVVKIGGKNVYLRSYFDIILKEYLQGLRTGNTNNFSQIDTRYGIRTLDKVSNNGKMVSDIQFRAILLGSLCEAYPDIAQVIVPRPTQGDALVYLLNTHTEYREQKRYIDTQKSIGYANRWKAV